MAALLMTALASPGFAATSVQFSRDTFLADEFRSPAQVIVERTGDSNGSLTVTVTATNGMAMPGEDFVPVSKPITFAPGETNKIVEIAVLDDYFAEPDKTVLIQLTNLPAGVTSTRPEATLLIRDDERPGSIDWSWFSTFGLSPQQLSNVWPSIVARLTDGKVILNFQVADSVPFCRIVRIKEDGSVDSTFQINDNPVTSQQVHAAPDGKLLVITNGANASGLQGRLNPNGTRDTNFNAHVTTALAFAVAPLLDGKILVWTLDSLFPVSLNGQTMPRLFRLNHDGTLDSSFVLNVSAWRWEDAIAPQTNGQILVAILESAFPRTSKLFRLNQDGSLDSGFQAGRAYQIVDVLTQADGRFVVGGNIPTYNDQTVNGILRLNQDGSIDGSFQSGTGFLTPGNEPGGAMLRPLPGGQILAIQDSGSYDGTPFKHGAVLNSDGTLDPSAFASQITFASFHGFDELLEVVALFVHGEFVGIAPSVDNPFNFDDGPFLFLGYGLNRLRTDLALRLVSTRRDSDGTTRLTANALPDRSYTLQSSENLADWSDLVTQPASTNRIEFTDTPTNSPAMRFYRLKGN